MPWRLIPIQGQSMFRKPMNEYMLKATLRKSPSKPKTHERRVQSLAITNQRPAMRRYTNPMRRLLKNNDPRLPVSSGSEKSSSSFCSPLAHVRTLKKKFPSPRYNKPKRNVSKASLLAVRVPDSPVYPSPRLHYQLLPCSETSTVTSQKKVARCGAPLLIGEEITTVQELRVDVQLQNEQCKEITLDHKNSKKRCLTQRTVATSMDPEYLGLFKHIEGPVGDAQFGQSSSSHLWKTYLSALGTGHGTKDSLVSANKDQVPPTVFTDKGIRGDDSVIPGQVQNIEVLEGPEDDPDLLGIPEPEVEFLEYETAEEQRPRMQHKSPMLSPQVRVGKDKQQNCDCLNSESISTASGNEALVPKRSVKSQVMMVERDKEQETANLVHDNKRCDHRQAGTLTAQKSQSRGHRNNNEGKRRKKLYNNKKEQDGREPYYSTKKTYSQGNEGISDRLTHEDKSNKSHKFCPGYAKFNVAYTGNDRSYKCNDSKGYCSKTNQRGTRYYTHPNVSRQSYYAKRDPESADSKKQLHNHAVHSVISHRHLRDYYKARESDSKQDMVPMSVTADKLVDKSMRRCTHPQKTSRNSEAQMAKPQKAEAFILLPEHSSTPVNVPPNLHRKRGARGKRKYRWKAKNSVSDVPSRNIYASRNGAKRTNDEPSYGYTGGSKRSLMWSSLCLFAVVTCMVPTMVTGDQSSKWRYSTSLQPKGYYCDPADTLNQSHQDGIGNLPTTEGFCSPQQTKDFKFRNNSLCWSHDALAWNLSHVAYKPDSFHNKVAQVLLGRIFPLDAYVVARVFLLAALSGFCKQMHTLLSHQFHSFLELVNCVAILCWENAWLAASTTILQATKVLVTIVHPCMLALQYVSIRTYKLCASPPSLPADDTRRCVLRPGACPITDMNSFPKCSGVGNGVDSVIPVKVDGVLLHALFDTGSQLTLMSEDALLKINKLRNGGPKQIIPRMIKATSATGHLLPISGSISALVEVNEKSLTGEIPVVKALSYDLILGRDIIRELGKVVIDFKGHRLSMSSEPSQFESPNGGLVWASTTTTVPPRSEFVILAAVDASANGETVMFTPHNFGKETDLVAANTIATVYNNCIPIRILNAYNASKSVYFGTKLGHICKLDDSEVAFVDRQVKLPDHQPLTVNNVAVEISDSKRQLLDKIDLSKTALEEGDKQLLKRLLFTYHDFFAEGDHDLGSSRSISHRIETGNALPIRQRPYQTAFAHRDVVSRKVKEMLDNKVIQPSMSEWASPIVLVKKKDGSWRFCCDYRKLNNVTRKDSYPMKRMDDILMTMGKAKYFTSLDLQSGYHQVPMHPDDRPKTAFVTYEGLFEYLKMPFGLCNAPATFQRMMERVLAGIDWKTCLVYLDDICIFGETPQEHYNRLQQVFARLRHAGLKLKVSKCKFARSAISFLGHTLSTKGISPECAKIEKIVSWPEPTSLRGVQSFLGFTGYYRTFVDMYAKRAAPLHALTEKYSKFRWTSEAQDAFDSLKRFMSEPPVLIFPDFRKVFILQTDASDLAVGAVLSQIADDNREHPIAFASRVLSKAERRYATIEKEALAVFYGVQHFRPYIYGHEVIVVTDHKPLKWLLTMKNPDGKLARWGIALQSYNITIHHRAGKDNKNADALSRRPHTATPLENHSSSKCEICNKLNVEARLSQEESTAGGAPEVYSVTLSSTDELKQAQQEDDHFKSLILFLENGEPMSDSCVFSKRIDEFELRDGSLYHLPKMPRKLTTRTSPQLVLPRSYREEAMTSCHDHLFGGHLGIRKTADKLLTRYWWPGCLKDVRAWCSACDTCAMRKGVQRKIRPPLQSIPAVSPWYKVACDIIGPLPLTRKGNKYIVVFMDYFTKWPECFSVPDTKTNRMARLFVEEIICRFGVPCQLLTDQGQNLISGLMQEVCRLLNVKKLQTTAYHPQCDGMVERFNRTLETMLSAYVSTGQDDWDVLLPYVLFAYRSSVHETTGESPFYLNMGRDPTLPLDCSLDLPNLAFMNTDDYRYDLSCKLQTAWELTRATIRNSQEKQKKFYDKHAAAHMFLPGDRVYLYRPYAKKGKTPKLARPWKGPYRIVSLTDDGTGANIVSCRQPYGKDSKRVNVQHLKFAPRFSALVSWNSNSDNDEAVKDDRKDRSQAEVEDLSSTTSSDEQPIALQREQDQDTAAMTSTGQTKAKSIGTAFSLNGSASLTGNRNNPKTTSPMSSALPATTPVNTGTLPAGSDECNGNGNQLPKNPDGLNTMLSSLKTLTLQSPSTTLTDVSYLHDAPRQQCNAPRYHLRMRRKPRLTQRLSPVVHLPPVPVVRSTPGDGIDAACQGLDSPFRLPRLKADKAQASLSTLQSRI